MQRISVEVWSDVACPWCYIGKRRLDTALSAVDGQLTVDVTFRSFELMPDLPEDFDGDAVDLLVTTKGIAPDQVRTMQGHVAAIAAGDGLDYDFASQRPANTRRAHQLLQLAREQGRQAEMKERLFAAHFVEGRHIGRDGELGDLAADVGLDRDAVVRALEQGTYLAAVGADVAAAAKLGIRGVPFFVFDGRFAVSGAQPVEILRRAITEAASSSVTRP